MKVWLYHNLTSIWCFQSFIHLNYSTESERVWFLFSFLQWLGLLHIIVVYWLFMLFRLWNVCLNVCWFLIFCFCLFIIDLQKFSLYILWIQLPHICIKNIFLVYCLTFHFLMIYFGEQRSFNLIVQFINFFFYI